MNDTTTTVLSFVSNMEVITPSVKATTFAEITPVAPVFPAAASVDDTSEAGTDANAMLRETATALPESAVPWRASLFASIILARSILFDSVFEEERPKDFSPSIGDQSKVVLTFMAESVQKNRETANDEAKEIQMRIARGQCNANLH